MKITTMSCAVLAVALFPGAALATPGITINSVLQRYPWSNVVDINYTVTGTSEESILCSVEFTATVNGESMSAGGALLEGEDGTFTHQWTVPAGVQARGCTMEGVITSAGSLIGDDYMIVDLTTGEVYYEALLNRQSYSDTRYNSDVYKTTKMVFRRVRAGTYSVQDGTTTTANMANDFYIGVFPVTVAQYRRMSEGSASSSMKPQASVSWSGLRYGTTNITDAATEFGVGLCGGAISNLNAMVAGCSGNDDVVFDLPTEAMWEVAARAMPADDSSHAAWRYFFTDQYVTSSSDAAATNAVVELLKDYAWFNANSGNTTHEVGKKAANPWGLFDVYGNVWEWCLDGTGNNSLWSQEPNAASNLHRRLRGGCNYNLIVNCRSGYRHSDNARVVHSYIGFRLAMIVKPL